MWRTESRYVCVLHMDTITKELSYSTTIIYYNHQRSGVIKTSKRNFQLVLQKMEFDRLYLLLTVEQSLYALGRGRGVTELMKM